MYKEKEVFIELQKSLKNSNQEIEAAYRVHRKLMSLILKEIRGECFYRYLELGGTIGLNLKNYKIYEYSHDKKEAFRMIYPNEDIENLKDIGLEARVDFKNISIDCLLLEFKVEDFNNFTDDQWNSFKKAVQIAFRGKSNPVGNIRNIDIEW